MPIRFKVGQMTDIVTKMNKVMENFTEKMKGIESKAFWFERYLGGPSRLVDISCGNPLCIMSQRLHSLCTNSFSLHRKMLRQLDGYFQTDKISSNEEAV